MASLLNYLRINRKRRTLSQEEVAFLLGAKGMDKGIKVCRDENLTRTPSLADALAYEVIYGKPIRELFAGLYERIEEEVAERAKILRHRKVGRPRPKRDETIINLVSKLAV